MPNPIFSLSLFCQCTPRSDETGGLGNEMSDALLKQVITITSLKIIAHLVFQLDIFPYCSLRKYIVQAMNEQFVSETLAGQILILAVFD